VNTTEKGADALADAQQRIIDLEHALKAARAHADAQTKRAEAAEASTRASYRMATGWRAPRADSGA
jgi:hypothetical protein